jgi:hypothetical protein
MASGRSVKLLYVVFALGLATVLLYLVVGSFEPFRTNWGDPWSDGNAMTSARYFARDGFVKTAFTPILDVGPLHYDSLRYTHYPPLPDLVAGVVQSAIGPDHLAAHRLLAIAFTSLGLLFLFRYLDRMWGRAVAMVSVAAFAMNLLFLEYADTVHHIPLYWMTGFGCLAAAVSWLDHERPGSLLLVALATFLCFFASYDFYFFLSIMVLATVRLRGHRVLSGSGLRLLLAFGVAGLMSIATKNLLVIWAVGVEQWQRDFAFQFLERTTSKVSLPYKELFSVTTFWRIWRFFSPLFYAGVLVQAIGIVDLVRGRKRELSLQPLVLLIAAVPFLLVFDQLVVEQYHPLLLLLPFAAVNLATLLVHCWRKSAIIACLLGALYVGWGVHQLAHFRKAFLRDEDAAAVAQALDNDHHQFVMSNIFVDGPVRYLWNRHLVGLDQDADNLRTDLRDRFDRFGDDSPITIVMMKHSSVHMFDKAVYAYFVWQKRWTWISRPDYYRNVLAREWESTDKRWQGAVKEVGRVIYESNDMMLRQVSRADLDRWQLEHLPKSTPPSIDFQLASSEIYKHDGFSMHSTLDELPTGFASMIERVPSRIVFTLQGFVYIATQPPKRTSSLVLPLPRRATRLGIELSTGLPSQYLTISINGHELAHEVWLSSFLGMKHVDVDVPAEVLRDDGPQTLAFGYRWVDPGVAARLHRIDIVPVDSPRRVCH